MCYMLDLSSTYFAFVTIGFEDLPTVDHLRQEKRRRETEGLMADRDGQLRHLRERLGTEEKERSLQQYGGIRQN